MGGQRLAGAKQQHLDMRLRFAERLRDVREVHVLGVAQPERLELHRRQMAARQPPEVLDFFAPGEQFCRVAGIHQIRRRFDCDFRKDRTMMIDAAVPRDAEKPRGEAAARIKLGNRAEGANEGVLRGFGGIRAAAAGLDDECINPALVTTNQLLERGQGALLALPGQLFVGGRLGFGYQSASACSAFFSAFFSALCAWWAL